MNTEHVVVLKNGRVYSITTPYFCKLKHSEVAFTASIVEEIKSITDCTTCHYALIGLCREHKESLQFKEIKRTVGRKVS